MNETQDFPGGTTATATASTPGEGPRVSRDEMRDLRRLRRSATDRKIAGVAGGLARHLDIDPTVLRVLFVVLAFFGGAGLLAVRRALAARPRGRPRQRRDHHA